MVDVRRPKLCPQCLAEDPIALLSWELTFFTVCPRHRLPLVDVCASCGSKITWGRPHLARCKVCNSAFCSPPGPASEHEAQLAQMISRKLHWHGSHVELDQEPNRSEEHTSELQSLMRISYAVFCLKKKKKTNKHNKPI